jgi:hypothetical protein
VITEQFQETTTAEYLEALYGGCDDGNIVFVNTKPGTDFKQVPAYFHVSEIQQAAEFVESYTGTDLFMKVNVMDHDKTLSRSAWGVGGGDDVEAIVSLHLDVDAGKNDKYLTPSAIIDILTDKMPLQPSGIIQTNGDDGGFHAYWLLDEPFYITTEADRKRCQDISTRWLNELRFHAKPGNIDGTANLDRVLRPVGSLRTSGNRVRALIWNDSRRHKLEDFHVPDRSPPKQAYDSKPFNGASPIEKYLDASGLNSVEAILQGQGYEDVGRAFWRRPGSESGAPTGEIYYTDGKQGFTVKSGAADPLSCENQDGSTGNWYSVAALWVSFHCGVDASNNRNPNAWKQAAEFCKRWLDDRKPKADTSHIERQTTQQADDRASGEGKSESEQPVVFSFSQLTESYPNKRKPIIDGLLRVGETMNVIGASKAGKSWLITGLLLSVATGRQWLGHYVERQKVLLIDNELHKEELSSRVKRVAMALQIDASELDGWFDVLPLRGRLMDIRGIHGVLSKVKQNDYRLIALDAFYRVLPTGMSENDNAAMADIYNHLDAIAGELDCSVVLNHHSSKGDQSSKSVTDVGSGAGSISRAADSHLIIRPHELEGCAVLEGVCRSFAPPEPRTIRWEWPLWNESGIEPEIKKPKTRGQASQQQNDEQADRKILEVVRGNPRRTSTQIRRKSGMGQTRVDRALVRLEEAGLLSSKRLRKRGSKQAFDVFEAIEVEASYD